MAPSRSRKRMTYAEKLEIVQAIEQGEKKAHLARKYDVNESTIRTIFKDREKIKKMAKSSVVQSNTLMQSLTLRNPTLQETERVLARFLQKQNRRGLPFNGGMIRRKAKTIYKEVARMRGITNPPHFIASKGWCSKFILRQNLHRVRWKKMPTKTYLSKHEQAAHGFKPLKDRITLLLTTNSEDEPPLPDEDVDLKLEIKEEVVDDTPTEFVNVLDHVEELPASKEEHDVDTLAVSKPFISASSSNVQFLDLNPHQMETPPVQKENPVDILTVTKPSIISSTSSALPSKVNVAPPRVEDGDEFHFFGMFVASQLRALPLRDALQAQLEIQTIIAQKRSQRLT